MSDDAAYALHHVFANEAMRAMAHALDGCRHDHQGARLYYLTVARRWQQTARTNVDGMARCVASLQARAAVAKGCAR